MKERRKWIEQIITIILVGAVLVTGGMSLNSAVSDRKAAAEYEGLRQNNLVSKDEDTQTEAAKEPVDPEEKNTLSFPAIQVDFKSLKEKNPDVIGWLYFPALEISYPVMQGEDNNYYLERSFEGEKREAGSIFADCEAAEDWSDRNTFVFGHNMRDGSMFGSFKKLMADTSVCQENPYFYIYLEDRVNVYEIFSCYQTTSDSNMYMTFQRDESYDEYVVLAKQNSVFASKRDMFDRSNIVTLSTCYGYVGSEKRILIHGVMNGAGKYE